MEVIEKLTTDGHLSFDESHQLFDAMLDGRMAADA